MNPRIFAIEIKVSLYVPQFTQHGDTDYFTAVCLFLETLSGGERCIIKHNPAPVDLRGLYELQKMIMAGKRVYATPEMLAALGIEA